MWSKQRSKCYGDLTILLKYVVNFLSYGRLQLVSKPCKNKMDDSPSSYLREELQKAFEALYKDSIKNMKLKNTIKNVTLEKEALKQRVTFMENEVT